MKENELKLKAGLAQTAEIVPPVLIQPPVVFPALTWRTDSQASETPGNEPQGDAAAQASQTAAVAPATVTSPRTLASLPIENDAVPTSRIAFGLRLTQSESPPGAELEIKTNTAVGDVQASRLPSEVLAVGAAKTSDNHSIADRSAPSGGNPRASDPPLSSRFEQASPTKLTDPVAIRALGDGSASNAGWPVEMLLRVGELQPRTEPRDPAIGPVTAPVAIRGERTNPGIEQRAWPDSNTDRSPQFEPPVIPGHPILPDDSWNQRPESKNVVAVTSTNHEPATGDVPARTEVSSSPTAGEQRVIFERPLSIAIPLGADADSNLDPRTAGVGIKQTAQLAIPAGGPDARRAGSEDDAANVINSQEMKTQTAISQAPSSSTRTSQLGQSRTTAQQPAAAQASASQTTPSGEVSRGSALAKTTAVQAAGNPAITHPAISPQAITIQAQSSQAPASAAISQSTRSQHSAQSMNNANEVEASPGSQLQPARQISLKLIGEDAAKVSVDVSEKGGKVQIAVRSSDPELAKSLRSDLGDLVGRLESKGFKTEAWVPATSRHATGAAAEQSDSNGSGYPRDAGSGTNQRQSRQGQNGSNQRQQARWMAQLEQTIATDETRTDNT